MFNIYIGLTACNLFLCNSFFLIQDSLARAVADEMQKVYRKELGPQPVPLTVPGEAIDEEDVSTFHFIHLQLIHIFIEIDTEKETIIRCISLR